MPTTDETIDVLPIAPTGVDFEGLRTLQHYCHVASRVRGFHKMPDRHKREIARLRATGDADDAQYADYLEDIETGNRQMLIAGEVFEAHEEIRAGHSDDEIYFVGGVEHPDDGTLPKPEGVGAEYADAFIRLCDESGKVGIDLAQEVKRKLAYNDTRHPMHGGKRF